MRSGPIYTEIDVSTLLFETYFCFSRNTFFTSKPKFLIFQECDDCPADSPMGNVGNELDSLTNHGGGSKFVC